MVTKEKKKTLLYIIIAALAIGLIIETGLLLKAHIFAPKQKRGSFAEQLKGLMPRQHAILQKRTRLQEEWNPFAEMRAMQQRMNRMFEDSFSRGYTSPAMQSFSKRFAFSGFSPKIDTKETKDAFIVTADIPGMEKDKIQVSVHDNLLTISGEREIETGREEEGYHSLERSYGSFSRTITLPGLVDENRISADYKNGVLKITLPKLKKGTEQELKQVTVT